MIIRAYLRASTDEQDAYRAKDRLRSFADENDVEIAAFYIENKSGASLRRNELMRLLEESKQGDVLLVESVDRLTRLRLEDWEVLKGIILDRGVHVVSIDLPTSHTALSENNASSDFMEAVLKAINAMLLDVLAASAFKELKEREEKQRGGIERARKEGKYSGRRPNIEVHERIELLSKKSDMSISDIVKAVGCSRATVTRVRKKMKRDAGKVA